ncbi:Short-chain dehydrogenase/reductase 2b [Camellia lanceoleosa]|uniref:Short-chain dehydrogenase/reductase 2b n=1 Tax=Camellia lanceoleosa TaxID=1840588 RepID=A0ACC0FIK3_9ERIC|nr:Short-chain dehydrogenase/reductase 2b [Camellia lanceoleosa]
MTITSLLLHFSVLLSPSVISLIAVVTGGNKGIGLEICRQLASNGIMVILTARDEKRCLEVVENLKACGLSGMLFHQLQVTDQASVTSMADFIKNKFGKLDILVNNAGISGSIIDEDAQKRLKLVVSSNVKAEKFIEQSYEMGETCLGTNYYGVKLVTEELIPLLQLSDSAKIVNVSSTLGQLELVLNEKAKKELSDTDSLTEEKVEEVLKRYLEDLLETKGWPVNFSAYIMSKAALNAYTRVLAKKYPNIAINALSPGFVKTDLNHHRGILTVEQGAKGPMNEVLASKKNPSRKQKSKGRKSSDLVASTSATHSDSLSMELQTDEELGQEIAVVTGANKGIGLEICRQLASNGITVILTTRDEKRSLEAVENLKTCGRSDIIFHQLDVTDQTSIASLADFIKTKFNKLDIFVNNAGISGITIDDMLHSDGTSVTDVTNQSYEGSDACFRTNYYGAKQVTEELIPLLQLSNSSRIVNVSSTLGQLKFISNEKAKKELNDIDGLTLEKVDDVIERFLEDLKEDLLETKGWPIRLSAYKVSKAALNAYIRVLAKKYRNIVINTVSPGHIKTDINQNTGTLTVERGAKWPVKLALLPHGGPSGLFYDQMEVSTF